MKAPYALSIITAVVRIASQAQNRCREFGITVSIGKKYYSFTHYKVSSSTARRATGASPANSVRSSGGLQARQ
jgi:hypothetical protein